MSSIRQKFDAALERIRNRSSQSADALAGRRAPRQGDDQFELGGVIRRTFGKARAVETVDVVLKGERTWTYDRETRTWVLLDPQDANNPNDVDPGAKRFAAAEQALAANGGAEATALEALSPDERAQYTALRQQLLLPADGRPEGDPVAVLALQKLLLQGKLPGDPALVGGQNLLQSLYALTSAPLQDGMDRAQMLSDLVQEVATPECINQHGPTCVATSTEIHLIQHNPAEFVRLFTGLASPEGRVLTAGGDELVRDVPRAKDQPGTGEPILRGIGGGIGRLVDGIVGPETSDTITQEVMGAALTEFANGDADYTGRTGLSGEEADKLAESLWGQPFELQEFEGTEADLPARQALLEAARSGESFFVGIRLPDGGGHKILVTGVMERDGETFVTYVNPWGRVEAMPADRFLATVHNANVGTTAATT